MLVRYDMATSWTQGHKQRHSEAQAPWEAHMRAMAAAGRVAAMSYSQPRHA